MILNRNLIPVHCSLDSFMYNRTFGIFFKKCSSQRCGIIENKRSIVIKNTQQKNTKLKYGGEI